MSETLRPVCSRAEAIEQTRQLSDALGRGMDPQIILPVAAVQRLGIPTHQSCQGHPDRALPYPWIQLHRRSEQQMTLLLQQHPLPDWILIRGRLLPARALEHGDTDVDIAFSLLPQTSPPMRELGARTNRQLRAELIGRLPAYQAQLQAWAEQLLELQGELD